MLDWLMELALNVLQRSLKSTTLFSMVGVVCRWRESYRGDQQ
jgi:hypothetical protein